MMFNGVLHAPAPCRKYLKGARGIVGVERLPFAGQSGMREKGDVGLRPRLVEEQPEGFIRFME